MQAILPYDQKLKSPAPEPHEPKRLDDYGILVASYRYFRAPILKSMHNLTFHIVRGIQLNMDSYLDSSLDRYEKGRRPVASDLQFRGGRYKI